MYLSKTETHFLDIKMLQTDKEVYMLLQSLFV